MTIDQVDIAPATGRAATADAKAHRARSMPSPRARSASIVLQAIRRHAVKAIAPLVTLLLLAGAWQWIASANSAVLPSLPSVGTELIDNTATYLTSLEYTLTNALTGLVLGIFVALFLATAIVHVPVLHAAIMPIAVFIHATPVLALAPALIVAFGFGAGPHIITVALMVFFPMLINAITGLKSVPQEMLEVFRSMAASRADIFLRLRVPSAMPFFFAAGKTCVTLAMIGAVVSEFTGSTKGIGAMIVTSTTYLNLPQMWAAIFVSAIVSVIMLGIVSLLERLVIRW